MLKVVRAAIVDDFGGVHSVPIPGRHHNIIKQMREAGYIGSVRQQGFLLNDGQFMNRDDAKLVAIKANQLKNGDTISATLTSEDLW